MFQIVHPQLGSALNRIRARDTPVLAIFYLPLSSSSDAPAPVLDMILQITPFLSHDSYHILPKGKSVQTEYNPSVGPQKEYSTGRRPNQNAGKYY